MSDAIPAALQQWLWILGAFQCIYGVGCLFVIECTDTFSVFLAMDLVLAAMFSVLLVMIHHESRIICFLRLGFVLFLMFLVYPVVIAISVQDHCPTDDFVITFASEAMLILECILLVRCLGCIYQDESDPLTKQ